MQPFSTRLSPPPAPRHRHRSKQNHTSIPAQGEEIILRALGKMNLRYLQTIVQPVQGIKKVTACCWSLNGKRLAVVTTDRVVHLFGES